MYKFNLILSKIEKIIVNVLLLSVTFLLFINVVLRTFGNAINWAEEFARYGIVWVTFIGGSICVYKGAHIGVDAIMMILKPQARKRLTLITIVISIAFTLIFIRQSVLITQRAAAMGQVSSTLKVSMVYIYGAMPVGGSLMLIRFVQEFFKRLKSFSTKEASIK